MDYFRLFFWFLTSWIYDKIAGDPYKGALKRVNQEIEVTKYLYESTMDTKRAMELHFELEKLNKIRDRVSKNA